MVSIVIPAKNEAAVLGETIMNIRTAGTEIPLEIIISDDGSRDGTTRIAGRLADQVVQKTADDPGHTIAAARNRGAAAARGEIIIFLDADVTVREPMHLIRTFIRAFERDERLLAATAFLEVLPEHATFADKFFSGIVNWFFLILNLLGFGCGVGEIQAIRATAFQEAGGYNPELAAGEDFDLFYRLSRRGRTRTIRSLAVYHTGRRAHVVGWPKLLGQWFMNAITIFLFKRSHSKVWVEVR